MWGMQGKPGDWMCASCGDHQFARNTECRKCGGPKTEGAGGCGGMMGGGAKGMGKKAGDWFCPACNDLQFAKNIECRKCQTPNPDPEGSRAAMEAGIAAGAGGQDMKPGDWYCPSCNDLQFAKNKVCRKCSTPNPDPEGCMAAASESDTFKPKDQPDAKPGDWTCSSCGDLQFARNVMCRMCGTPNMGGGKGKGTGKGGKGGGMGNMAGMMQMMNMMGGGGGGGGGNNNMVQIPAQMLAMMMGGGMAGGGGGGGGGNWGGNNMGGKGGGKGSKGKSSPY